MVCPAADGSIRNAYQIKILNMEPQPRTFRLGLPSTVAGADGDTVPRTALMVATSNTSFYEVFDRVWRWYKGYTGLQLSSLTHAPETPWSIARWRGDDYLSNDEIRDHFISIAQRIHV